MASEFIDRMLASGEVVLVSTRQHWIAAIRYCLRPIALGIAAVFLWLLVDWLLPEDGLLGTLAEALGWLVVFMLIVAVVWLPVLLAQWWSREYVLTNRRAIRAYGIVRKRSLDSSLEQINDIGLAQSFLGRQLDYADLTIYTASSMNETYDQLIDGVDFRRAVLEAKDAVRAGAPLSALPDDLVVKGGKNEASLRADGKLPVPEAAVAAAAGAVGATALEASASDEPASVVEAAPAPALVVEPSPAVDAAPVVKPAEVAAEPLESEPVLEPLGTLASEPVGAPVAVETPVVVEGLEPGIQAGLEPQPETVRDLTPEPYIRPVSAPEPLPDAEPEVEVPVEPEVDLPAEPEVEVPAEPEVDLPAEPEVERPPTM